MSARLPDHVAAGDLVAVADGAGMATGLLAELSDVARERGDVSLLLGWTMAEPEGLDLDAFADVRTVMGGYGLGRAVRDGRVRYLPSRLGTVPRLLAGPLRPDVVLLGARPVADGLAFGSEVGWANAAVATGATVLAEANHGLPAASALPPLDPTRVHVVAEVDRPPVALPPSPVSEEAATIGGLVASLLPDDAAVQVGPGAIGEAFLRAVDRPVVVDSGVVVDGVVDLDRRGLLRGEPVAAYLAGSPELFAWADGRPVLHGVEHTHDLSRLAARPLVAVNTALEVDLTGQVNVEAVAGRSLAGIGGHADYALAASRSAGASVIALPTTRGGRTTLVHQLSAPVSTARADVDVVVTELGVADLRGLDDVARRRALLRLWDGVVV